MTPRVFQGVEGGLCMGLLEIPGVFWVLGVGEAPEPLVLVIGSHSEFRVQGPVRV